MLNYYAVDIIPIILKEFKVNSIIISGLSDKNTVQQIISYCDNNNVSFTAIDSEDNFEGEFIKDYTLNQLPNLKNYDAIFINDDPNWYTVYNELKIIKENNASFPLVFICNNVFPHKNRDSYIDPKIIPKEFRNEYASELIYKDITLSDGFYHAINKNSSKNGVQNAINCFLSENNFIKLMDIKLSNGTIILYNDNSISHIRLHKLFDALINHEISFENLPDYISENQILIDNISEAEVSKNMNDELKTKLNDFKKNIRDYENEIKIKDLEIDYKVSQIEGINSKLNLKDSQIERMDSILLNHENEINLLNSKLSDRNNKIKDLKLKLNKKEENFQRENLELNYKISFANSQIKSLKLEINEKEKQFSKNESFLNNQLNIAKKKIDDYINNANKKNLEISFKNQQLKEKEQEIIEHKSKFKLIQQQYNNQFSKLDNKEYCISCYKNEIVNKHLEIQYLKRNYFIKKLLSPMAYLFLLLKSNPKELSLNIKLYNALKNSKCFDIGFYLNNNKDILESKWYKYFSPELHYICSGFDEQREFNKKFYKRNSKKELLNYILSCDK